MGVPIKLLSVLVLLMCIYATSSWFIPPIRWPHVGKGIVRVGKKIGKGVKALFKGCCGLHPSVCRNEKEFKNRQYDIKRKSASMDRDWIKVKKTLNHIKIGNDDNSKIYRELKRITLVSTGTLEIMDPEILIKFNNVSNEIKKGIMRKNRTVLEFGIDQLENEYDKKKKKTESSLLDMASIGGMSTGLVKMTADMFQIIKKDATAKLLEDGTSRQLKKAYPYGNKLFGFHYKQQLNEQYKIQRDVSSGLNLYKGLKAIQISAFAIIKGFSAVINWVKDLAGCKKRGDRIREQLRKIKPQHEKIKMAYNKLQKFKVVVAKNWNLVRAQIQNPGLLENLALVEDITRQSSSISSEQRRALQKIVSFRRYVKSSNPNTVIAAQKSLIEALGDVTYNMECYKKKLNMYEAVHTRCKLGLGSFDDLYSKAEVDFRPNTKVCNDESGLPYTTKKDVFNFLKKKGNKEKFEVMCLLNSGIKRTLSCSKSQDGFTVQQVATYLNIDVKTMNLYLKSCPILNLTPVDKSDVCSLKKYRLNVHEIYREFPKYNKVSIDNVFRSCD